MSIAKEIVGFAIKAGSSDIHLEEGSPIAIRVNSDITILDQILRPSDMDRHAARDCRRRKDRSLQTNA